MLLQYVSVKQRKTASDTLLQFTMRWDEMLHSYTAKSALLKNLINGFKYLCLAVHQRVLKWAAYPTLSSYLTQLPYFKR